MSALDNFAKVSLIRKIIGVVVLFLVAGLVYYFVRYQSLASDHTRLVRQHSILQTKERQFRVKRESYEADVRRLSQLRASFAAQSRILPPDAEMSTFLDGLNNHAELTGLEISLVQPMDEEVVGFYAKIPVQLEFKGRYHELAKFFYNVGRLERVINIENINFTLSGNEESEESDVVLGAQVLATTFRSIEEDSETEESGAGGG